MAERSFLIFKESDASILKALKKICLDCGANENTDFIFEPAESYARPLRLKLNELDENESLLSILKINSTIFHRLIVNFAHLDGASIEIKREDISDKAKIFFNDQSKFDNSVALLSAANKHLNIYARTQSIDKLLGNELAEFYRKREEGLLRLEALSQKLIEQNEEYRQKLDKELLSQKEKVVEEVESQKKKLEEEFTVKENQLKNKEEELATRTQQLDDRDSKHARRSLRNDLKNALAGRSKEFTLTKKTTKKRLPIHILFCLLLLVFGFFIGITLWGQFSDKDPGHFVYYIIRLSISTIGFITMAIFYIRWNDHWFRQHADEEFRLKRLELDIDRASWVVEMALEWKDEKGTEIPEELIDRLTRNLFVDREKVALPKHPGEDLASALLSVSKGLKIQVPGIGEVILDGKGLRKFKKSVSESDESSE